MLNIYNYMRRPYPEKSDNDVKENALATGASSTTVYRVRNEASEGSLTTPKKFPLHYSEE